MTETFFKTEEPLNQWNKACWLKNISHKLFIVVLPTSTKLNIYRSEHFQPLLESCSQSSLFKWSSVNSLGSFMSCFAGTHIAPREISPVSLTRAQPKHHSEESLLCFPSVSSKMCMPGSIFSLLGTCLDNPAIEVAQCMHTINMSTHHIHKLLQALPNLPQRFFQLEAVEEDLQWQKCWKTDCEK